MANAPRFSRMVILGLGSPTLSAVSRFQLALALVLAEHLGLEEKDVDLYDPVFTPVDAETMRAKKVGTVLDRAAADAACGPDAAPARAPTFWYMPHCEVALYENVLRANGGGNDTGGGDDSGGGDGGDAAARKKKSARRSRFWETGSRRTSFGGSVGAARPSARRASWRRRSRSRGKGWR